MAQLVLTDAPLQAIGTSTETLLSLPSLEMIKSVPTVWDRTVVCLLYTSGTKLELPVLVAAFYGLRRGEVLGLKWDAIDFERGTLTIKRTVTSVNVGGKTQIIEQESAKTKSSMRTLPLLEMCIRDRYYGKPVGFL